MPLQAHATARSAPARGGRSALLRSMWGAVGPGISTALEAAAELIARLVPAGSMRCLHP
jgi:hypothetical protein